MVNYNYYYSVSLKFPFIYESNVTVQYSPGLPVGTFKFEPLLFPSVIAFVATTALVLLVTIIKQTLEVVYYGSQKVQDYINLVRIDSYIDNQSQRNGLETQDKALMLLMPHP